MNQPAWLAFPLQNGKRKRAELACEICHSRKVKCDLQTRNSEGHSNCSNCAASAKDCRYSKPKPLSKASAETNRPRKSKRDRAHRNKVLQEEPHPLTPPGDSNNEAEPEPAGQASSVAEMNTNTSFPTHNANMPVESHHQTPMRVNSLSMQGYNPMTSNSIPSSTHNHSHHSGVRSHSITSPVTSSLLRGEPEDTYSADTALLQVYGPEHENDAINQELAKQARSKSIQSSEVPSSDLLQGFREVYFGQLYTWCPVLDETTFDDEVMRSPMLANAVALAGSHIQPPMIPDAGPATYYDRAKRIFYDEEEDDTILSLKALCLFYWWSPKPPTAVHKNSSWWWQAVIIRHCQHLGINREPALENPLRCERDLSLRRRIWWTAFARERLTAMCQRTPAIIDPDDCNIPELTMEDFPEPFDRTKAEIFIYWVRLCSIIGRIAKCMHTYAPMPTAFPEHLARELISWVNSLPAHLRLPIDTGYTTNFNRDVHQLYLPYLAVIVVLHLKRSSQTLPQARAPAILAASCIARILKDVLARGAARSLMAITCWYTGTAFVGLLAASKTPNLAQYANADLDILHLAVKQLKIMWPTATIYDNGFERLRTGATSTIPHNPTDGGNHQNLQAFASGGFEAERASLGSADNSIDWMEYFPFVSPATSKVVENLLTERNRNISFDEESFQESTMLYFQDLFEPYTGLADMTYFLRDL